MQVVIALTCCVAAIDIGLGWLAAMLLYEIHRGKKK